MSLTSSVFKLFQFMITVMACGEAEAGGRSSLVNSVGLSQRMRGEAECWTPQVRVRAKSGVSASLLSLRGCRATSLPPLVTTRTKIHKTIRERSELCWLSLLPPRVAESWVKVKAACVLYLDLVWMFQYVTAWVVRMPLKTDIDGKECVKARDRYR